MTTRQKLPMRKDVFLHKDAWKATFRGYDIVSCAVRDRNFIYLALTKIPAKETCDDDAYTRSVVLYLHEEQLQERWAHQGLANFTYPVAGACRLPIAQGMIVSRNGDTYAMGSKQKGMEKISSTDMVTGVQKVRCIQGRSYAAGMFRQVFRRTNVGRWDMLPVDGLPVLKPGQFSVDQGFADVDGFSENDLYAAGGKGDVWYFNGSRWQSCKFPLRQELHAICCGGDGNVYVSGENNLVYGLIGNRWLKISDGPPTNHSYKDLRWFDNKLWLSGKYSLAQVIDGNLVEAMHDGAPIKESGAMDCGDGVLVIASNLYVTLFDGESVRTLVAPY